MPKATCHVCHTETDLPTAPTDSSKVVGEPAGWTVLSVNTTGQPVVHHRLYGRCFGPIRTLLAA